MRDLAQEGALIPIDTFMDYGNPAAGLQPGLD